MEVSQLHSGGGGVATPSWDKVDVCCPGNRQNQENFALHIGKSKKKIGHFTPEESNI